MLMHLPSGLCNLITERFAQNPIKRDYKCIRVSNAKEREVVIMSVSTFTKTSVRCNINEKFMETRQHL